MAKFNSKKPRVVITGAGGLVGKTLSAQISKNRELLSNFDILFCQKNSLVEKIPNVGVVNIDLTCRESTVDLLRDADTLVHLAGVPLTMGSDYSLSHRILMMRNLNDSVCQAVKSSSLSRVIWLSSTTGYPRYEGGLTEDMFLNDLPPDRYFEVGQLFRELESQFDDLISSNRSVIILRPTALYGDFQSYSNSAPHILVSLLKRFAKYSGQSLTIRADPIEARDWLYSDDMATALIRVLQNINHSTHLNIGSGVTTSMFELYKLMIEVCGVDNLVEVVAEKQTSGQPIVRAVNTGKSRTLIGDYAKTDIRSGLFKTHRFYVDLMVSRKNEVL